MPVPDADETRALDGGSEPLEAVGPYRLLRRLGEGGMGEVWLAQQTEPIRRQVAVKILKAGMDSARVIARFQAERQTLALMDHPCIAKVFDAGMTRQGLPYFVMEYVRGESITAFCDRQKLPLAARLELFIQLCEGVQHAHQKGIIHRDLKPSNVLVALVDDRPVPRIIDFGIAKALAQPLSEGSLFTELGMLVGTPEYMSPEQAAFSSDVDTRSDVYALGLLLYELLVGRLPFDRETFRRGGLDDVRRTIQDTATPRPSTRLKTDAAEVDTVAANRQMPPAKLAGALRGDLDWIVMKALEKERARRYATANALAMDVRRHRDHEPVSAGPPSATYRLSKFAARHRAAVAAFSAVAILIVVFAGVMALQARRIARERDRANQEAAAATQISNFLVGLFTVSDPGEARGQTLTAREILDRGSAQVESTLRDQPRMQARLGATIGRVYSGLGMYVDAQRLLERALDTQRRLAGDDDLETLTTQNELANVLWYRGQYAAAEPLYGDVVRRRTAILGLDHPDTLRTRFDLASLYLLQKRWQDFERIGLDTLARQRRVLGNSHTDTIGSLNSVQYMYFQTGRYAEAEPVAAEVLAARQHTLGNDHPDTLGALHNLATIVDALGRDAEAERLYLRARDLKRRVLGDEHPDTCRTLYRLAGLYLKQHRYVEAEPAALAAYQGFNSRLGPANALTVQSVEQIASIYDATGRAQQAREWRAKVAMPGAR